MGPGPYATLDVTLTSGTTADFDITTFDPYLLVAGSSFAFNTTDDISFSNLVSTPGTNPIAQAGNNQNVSSWGVFKYVFDAQNAAAGNTEFTFTATLVGGGTWANELDIFDANNKGYIAAVHAMYPPNCEVGACTGFATFGSAIGDPQNGGSRTSEPASAPARDSPSLRGGCVVRSERGQHVGRSRFASTRIHLSGERFRRSCSGHVQWAYAATGDVWCRMARGHPRVRRSATDRPLRCRELEEPWTVDDNCFTVAPLSSLPWHGAGNSRGRSVYGYVFDTHDGQQFLVSCRVEPKGKYRVLINPLMSR